MLSVIVQSYCLKYCISNGKYHGQKVTAAEICPDALGCIGAEKDQTMLSFWDEGEMKVCSSFSIRSQCEQNCDSECEQRRVFHGFQFTD